MIKITKGQLKKIIKESQLLNEDDEMLLSFFDDDEGFAQDQAEKIQKRREQEVVIELARTIETIVYKEEMSFKVEDAIALANSKLSTSSNRGADVKSIFDDAMEDLTGELIQRYEASGNSDWQKLKDTWRPVQGASDELKDKLPPNSYDDFAMIPLELFEKRLKVFVERIENLANETKNKRASITSGSKLPVQITGNFIVTDGQYVDFEKSSIQIIDNFSNKKINISLADFPYNYITAGGVDLEFIDVSEDGKSIEVIQSPDSANEKKIMLPLPVYDSLNEVKKLSRTQLRKLLSEVYRTPEIEKNISRAKVMDPDMRQNLADLEQMGIEGKRYAQQLARDIGSEEKESIFIGSDDYKDIAAKNKPFKRNAAKLRTFMTFFAKMVTSLGTTGNSMGPPLYGRIPGVRGNPLSASSIKVGLADPNAFNKGLVGGDFAEAEVKLSIEKFPDAEVVVKIKDTMFAGSYEASIFLTHDASFTPEPFSLRFTSSPMSIVDAVRQLDSRVRILVHREILSKARQSLKESAEAGEDEYPLPEQTSSAIEFFGGIEEILDGSDFIENFISLIDFDENNSDNLRYFYHLFKIEISRKAIEVGSAKEELERVNALADEYLGRGGEFETKTLEYAAQKDYELELIEKKYNKRIQNLRTIILSLQRSVRGAQ